MRTLYNEVKSRLSKIDFDRLWPGFKPVRFALYDDNQVYLEEEVFPKDNRFLGNSAIDFNGEFIAIWYITNPEDIKNLDVFTSKIVHEMFHAYQHINKELRWPNEVEALKYEYNKLNLSIKYEESKLILELLDNYSETTLNQLLRLRKYRAHHFPFELEYETKIEVVEGMADFVELLALHQLDRTSYDKMLNYYRDELMDIKNYMIIRWISYHIGSLLLIALKDNYIDFSHTIGQTEQTIYQLLSSDITYQNVDIRINEELSNQLDLTVKRRQEIIKQTIAASKNTINCDYTLIGFDPLNSFILNHLLYCKHFIAYFDENNNQQFIIQELVAELDINQRVKKLFL